MTAYIVKVFKDDAIFYLAASPIDDLFAIIPKKMEAYTFYNEEQAEAAFINYLTDNNEYYLARGVRIRGKLLERITF